MTQLSFAYVTGLLSDLEVLQPRLASELLAARKKAERIDGELSSVLVRMDKVKAGLAALVRKAEDMAALIAERNSRIASAHQEIATIKRRAEDVKLEMDRVGPGAVYNRLRRDRAKLLVQIEDREAEIKKLTADVESARHELASAERDQVSERDKQRVVLAELDALQSQLPSPYLYTRLFEVNAAAAHCRLYLDGDPEAWKGELSQAIAGLVVLHRDLLAGKYRLDKNSDLIGGRAMASAEALYAAVAMGQLELARELFGLMASPSLLFDHIFNVFRVWCLGLFLLGRERDLVALLKKHQFAAGLRGGYAQAFAGLLRKDTAQLAGGLRAITKHEWELWQDPALVRGAGVVNLGALAITRLALDRGLSVQLPGPTVPDAVIAGPRRVAGAR